MEFEPEEGRQALEGAAHASPVLPPRGWRRCLHYNGFTDIFFTADFTDQPADQWVDSMVVSCRVAALARPRKASLVSRTKLLAAAKKRVRRA